MNNQSTQIDVAETARVKLAEHYEYSRTDNSIRRLVLLSNMLKNAPQQHHMETSGPVSPPRLLDEEKQEMAQSWLDSCLDDLIQDDDVDQITLIPVSFPYTLDSAPTTRHWMQHEQIELDAAAKDDDGDLPPLCSSASSDDSIWSNDSEDDY
ncbi:hypothetical protein Unana1_00911 [Umbelopsis nana]